MDLNLIGYHEEKPHRLKRLVWVFVNRIVMPIVSFKMREMLLRMFGAKIGWGGALYRTLDVYAPWNLEVADLVCIGPRVEIYSKDRVVIGKNVVISQDAYLCTASHDITSPTMGLVTRQISIGNNVWIGAKATILPGVTIGEGAVVGACAVVAKDVPPWSVVAGNPARVVKRRVLNEA